MSKLRNILAVVVLLSTVSCVVDDIDAPSHGIGSSDKVTVIGRMTRFDEKDVTTRGVKNENEAKMTSMAMAIFPVVNNNSLGECIYYSYEDNEAELLFTITRSEMQIAQKEPYAMYIFCNMPGLEDYEAKALSEIKLDDILNEYLDVKNINIPANGFPMIGSLGDYFSTAFDCDNQKFILSPIGSDGKLTVPTVAQPDGNGGWGNAEPQDILTIPMKAMFAKVNFTIEVRPDQTIEGGYSPQFTLENYTVNNVPSTVDYSYTSNYDSAVLTDSFGGAVSGNTIASGANKINFTFYLPERLLTADRSLDSVLPQELRKGTYSKDVDADQNGYRDEDEVYHQRFKSKMLGDDQKATNIVISGEFRDHQNHYWDVDYTIYLGENNSTDFNIKRNSEYNNYVTIRGIQSTDDMSDNANGIAIDHRVNVERTQPAIISLRREVLLDSHFEVRPMRIRKSSVSDSNINAVKVEVVNPGGANDKSGTWWMRLERSYGEGGNGKGKDIYITIGVSAGKSKYFTYDLITGTGGQLSDLAPLNNSTSVVVPLSDNEEIVWIYVDECTEVGDEVRSGIVKVSYGSYNGTTFTPANNAAYPDLNYVINQRKLFDVTGPSGKDYHIEYEEEYLHNFDADSNYGDTEYEGMQWGLNNAQLSYKNKAIAFDTWFMDLISSGTRPYYDFYIKKHDSGSEGTMNEYNGYQFAINILSVINNENVVLKDGGWFNPDYYDVPQINTDTSDDIKALTLAEKPRSAVEYCYNKNKRRSDGSLITSTRANGLNHDIVYWYLPAIDEIEDIVMSKYGDDNLFTYTRFKDFQEKFYWSSQPAYLRNYYYYYGVLSDIFGDGVDEGDGYVDYTTHARATKVVWDINKQDFDYIKSGIEDDTYYMGTSIVNASNSYYYEGVFPNGTKKPTMGTTQEQVGCLPRTSYARVRCVRKQ